MSFVYGLKTLKSCLTICFSNLTLKDDHESFCIKKNRLYRDKIYTIVTRNTEHLLDLFFMAPLKSRMILLQFEVILKTGIQYTMCLSFTLYVVPPETVLLGQKGY